MHAFNDLPREGAWKLSGAYEGSEVVRFAQAQDGVVLEGTSVGVEEGVPWSIHYVIQVDNAWRFQNATITDYAGKQLKIEVSNEGTWSVNGEPQPDLQGCIDIDLEASAVTNTLPIHRLSLATGEQGESAAAYIRTNSLKVERLDQTYERLPNTADGLLRFDYRSPRFSYHDILHFGADGLAMTYPHIGTRVPLNNQI